MYSLLRVSMYYIPSSYLVTEKEITILTKLDESHTWSNYKKGRIKSKRKLELGTFRLLKIVPFCSRMRACSLQLNLFVKISKRYNRCQSFKEPKSLTYIFFQNNSKNVLFSKTAQYRVF